MSESLVIIPTYNEKENVKEIIQAVFALDHDFHVLIVDDSSPDGTADIVRDIQKSEGSRLHLEVRTEKSGLGTAYIHGFRWALKRPYKYIFEMDADFSHPPEKLLELYAANKENYPCVSIGSRYCRGGKVKNWPLGRILMSYFASVYVRIITGMMVKDTTAGFVCYSREFLEQINLDKIRFVGYAFQIEMKYAAGRLGFKRIEVPITFVDRLKGKSKMSPKIFREAFKGVWKIRFSSPKGYYRQR